VALPKGTSNSGIKNLKKHQFKKGESGFHFKPREAECVQCNKKYTSRGPRSSYCSTVCKEKSRPDKQKTKFVCQFCDDEFLRRAANNAGKFCSRRCSGMWVIANGKKNYVYRAFLYKPHKCNRCGIDDYQLLCVHHRDQNRKNNDIENLEILCANCHYRIHWGKGKTRKAKLDNIVEYLRRQEEKRKKV